MPTLPSGVIVRWDCFSVYSKYLILLLVIGNWIWVLSTESYLININLKVQRISKYSLLIIFAILNATLIYGCFIDPQSVIADFQSPFGKGDYYVVQGGKPPLMNRGHFLNNKQDKYSIDFVRLNRFGFSVNTYPPRNISHYNIFNDSVYSPCDGKVLDVRQEVDCNIELTKKMTDKEVSKTNNIVVIGYQDAELIFAHLKKGSIVVEKGQKIKPSDFIGLISNAGAVEPHLHMQLIQDGKSVPFKVNGRFLHNNSIVRSNQ